MADEVTCLACNDGFELSDHNTCDEKTPEEPETPETPETPEAGKNTSGAWNDCVKM